MAGDNDTDKVAREIEKNTRRAGDAIKKTTKKIIKAFKKLPVSVRLTIIIIISFAAFIIIITAAWKEKLLEVTSGQVNRNEKSSYYIS